MPIGGFPKRKLVRFRYVQEKTIDAGIAPIGVQVFRANGMFDPDLTGTGHQPSNFDVWINSASGIYDHFTVLGSKITVSPVQSGQGSNSPGAYFGILLSDSGTRASSMTIEEIMENKLCKFSRVPVGIATGYNRNTLTRGFSAKKFFGRKNSSSIIGDVQMRGSASADPTEQAFYELFVGSVAGTDPAAQSFLIEIEYIAMLTEPKPQVYS